MKKITIIEAPTNLGLKEPAPGIEPGVKLFPAAMAKTGFAAAIGAREKIIVTPSPYTMNVDKASGVRNADAIVSYSRELADAIGKTIDSKAIPLVIGGDCSVMIGAAVALKRRGNYGLFHLDGHTDYMWPEFSQTAGAAGMGMAIVAGVGHDKLTNIEGLKPYIREEDAYCVGNREYYPPYVELTLKSRLHYFDLEAIRKEGPRSVSERFLQMITEKKLDGFWIHFDVDVLNDVLMPCVDSRTEDGLWYDELKEMLRPLLASSYFTGMEFTILDPTLDPDGRYVEQFAKEMAKVFRPERRSL